MCQVPGYGDSPAGRGRGSVVRISYLDPGSEARTGSVPRSVDRTALSQLEELAERVKRLDRAIKAHARLLIALQALRRGRLAHRDPDGHRGNLCYAQRKKISSASPKLCAMASMT